MTWAPTHVAFLRAINVGGRRLKMAELVAAIEPLGLGEVRTWQATGNLVFASDLPAEALQERIPEVLEAALGIEVPCVVVAADEVRSIVAAEPFTDAELAATAGRLQVLLLGDAPSPAVREAVLEHSTDDDPLRFGERVLWWLPRAGVSDSSLRIPPIERLLGVCTMRTHGAVLGLAAKHLVVA